MQTIALDIGNVCLRIYPERCLEMLGIPPESITIPDELMKSIIDMEEGRIDESEWLKIFQKATENQFSNHQLRKAYISILGEEIAETSNFIQKAIEKNIRLIFFSDTSPIHINNIYRNLSFANLVSGGVFSFETKSCKPNNKMYEEYEKRYGKPLLYLDDKPKNITAGIEAGWNSQLFDPLQADTLSNYWNENK